MDPLLLQIFVIEVRLQCQFVLAANEQLREAESTGQARQYWFALQNLLIAAANVSKLAWGGGRPLERVDVRRAVGLPPTSPLHCRDVRNYFEHVDKYLTDFWRNRPASGRFEGRIIATHEVIRPPTKTAFHKYNPETRVLTFHQESVSIPSLVEAAQKVINHLNAAAQTKARLEREEFESHFPPRRHIREMRCAHCGNLTPQCTCADAQGNPFRWE